MERKQIEDMIRNHGISEADGGRLYIQYPGNPDDVEKIKAAKPEIISYFIQVKAEKEEHARRIAAIEGLDTIRKAIADEERYERAFERMMEDEFNDGVNPPSKPELKSSDLKRQYPRAAAYLLAEDYYYSDHYARAGAGRRALGRIINGENHETVIAEMKTEWDAAVQESAMND